MSEIPITALKKLYARTEGKAWEPPDPDHPYIVRMIEGGWVRRCNGRCGYELLRDAMVKWTDAAHQALRAA